MVEFNELLKPTTAISSGIWILNFLMALMAPIAALSTRAINLDDAIANAYSYLQEITVEFINKKA